MAIARWQPCPHGNDKDTCGTCALIDRYEDRVTQLEHLVASLLKNSTVELPENIELIDEEGE